MFRKNATAILGVLTIILATIPSAIMGSELIFSIQGGISDKKELTDAEFSDRSFEILDEFEIAVIPELIVANPTLIEFDLPDGRTFVARRTHYADYGEDWSGKDWKSWSGVALGSGTGSSEDVITGFVHFNYHEDVLTGMINLPGEQYEIGSSEHGQHYLARILPLGSSCALSGEGAVDEPEYPMVSAMTPLPGSSSIERNLRTWDAPAEKSHSSVLDVLLLYPIGLNALTVAKLVGTTQDAIAVANSIFENSSISASYNLLSPRPISGIPNTPSTRWQEWLAWMRDSSNVHELRADLRADVVVLVVPRSWGKSGMVWCGAANLPEWFEGQLVDRTDKRAWNKRAFTVLRTGCGKNDYTLAHEIGHTYGMRHRANESAGSKHRFPHGRGVDDFYYDDGVGSGWRATVMGCINGGLGNGGNFARGICDRVPFFSDPNGLAGDSLHDNASAGRQQVVVYADYK